MATSRKYRGRRRVREHTQGISDNALSSSLSVLAVNGAGSSTDQQSIARISDQSAETAEHKVILSALKTLYADRLEPLDHHVRRRIEEQTGHRWDPEHLVTVASAIPSVRVEQHTGRRKRWLYLDGVRADFVDQTSECDPYPASLWQQLKSFIDSAQLPQASSRYDIGSALQQQVRALKKFSLGEVCHIVQLAVTNHRILGYRHGRIVPYGESLEFEKHSNAKQHQPTGMQSSEAAVSCWEELRCILVQLLEDPSHADGIELSSLKALVRSRYHKELSETALGHTKLSTLVTDPHLTDLGHVGFRGSELVFCRCRVQDCTNSVSDQTAITQHKRQRGRKHRGLKSNVMEGAERDAPAEVRSEALDSRAYCKANEIELGSQIAGHSLRMEAGCNLSDRVRRKHQGALASKPALRRFSLPSPLDGPPCTGESSSACPAGSFPSKQSGTNHADGGCYLDMIVYEPVVTWVPRVIRTFIDFPLQACHGGARREKSSPPRLEGEGCSMPSPTPSRASSEQLGRPSTKNADVAKLRGAQAAAQSNGRPQPRMESPASFDDTSTSTSNSLGSHHLQPVPAG